MKFRAAHRATSYLMVASAILTLAIADGIASALLLVVALVMALSWYSEPGTRLHTVLVRVEPLFKFGSLIILAIAGYRIYTSFPEPDLSPLLDFILYLACYRLLIRRTNRDYLQLYVLSFLIVLAATWLAQTAFFAVGFSVYVLTSTWALILFHLRREIEDNYLVKHHATERTQRVTVTRVLDSRRVVGGWFFAATGLAAIGVLLGAVLVFALAPRIGIGFLTGGVRRQTSVVGFSDEVRLGRHGVISDDNQMVILRVRIPEIENLPTDEAREQEVAGLYFRGTVYDRYHEGQWVRSQSELLRTVHLRRPSPDGGSLAFVLGPEHSDSKVPHYTDLDRTTRQEIQVIGLRHPVAFALDQPFAFAFSNPAPGSFVATDIEPRWSGESLLRVRRMLRTGEFTPMQDFNGANYVAYSRRASSRTSETSTPIDRMPPGWLALHLDVPAPLAVRLRPLAQRIAGDTQDGRTKIERIVNWLHTNKQYTVDLKRNEAIADPIEDFLLSQPAGHCEYFAAASAILLRLLDVPTRYVNGFLGGEWNPLTGHVTVRDNRAHSWVEAYVDGLGWLRVDATPPALRTTRMSRWRQVVDSLELWWSTWVLEYDASRQLQLARELASSTGLGRGGAGFKLPRLDARTAFGVLGGVVLAIYGVRLLRQRRRTRARPHDPEQRARRPAQQAYQRALAALQALGIRREPADTARDILARVAVQAPALRAPLVQLTSRYERVRYGDQPLDADLVRDMFALCTQIELLVRDELAARARTARSNRQAA